MIVLYDGLAPAGVFTPRLYAMMKMQARRMGSRLQRVLLPRRCLPRQFKLPVRMGLMNERDHAEFEATGPNSTTATQDLYNATGILEDGRRLYISF